MKKVNLILFILSISLFDLAAQTISLQYSGGSSISDGLIHPTGNGQDFTVKDALASTSPGIFADVELQLYFEVSV